MGEDVVYSEMRLNSTFVLFLNFIAVVCCCATTELETNQWFLTRNGGIKPFWEPYIELLKSVAFVTSFVLIVVNIRYHVLKLTLNMNRMNVPQEKRVSIWQVSRTVRALFLESLMLLVTQIPYYNGDIMISAGLSRHDPPAVYRFDVFIFLAMICLRLKFIYRCIYIHQDLFSVDAISLSKITGTPITARLGIRSFIAKKPATVSILFSIGYLFTIAYVHNKLEQVTNYWLADRFCVEVDDQDDCMDIYNSEYPVTYLNSMWIHFVSASTIGYGEYQVSTQFGRLLVCLSFIVGLLLSSFVVTVLFDTLSINSSEQYIIDKLRMKKMNKRLVDKAATLLQQLARGYLLRSEMNMLRHEHPDYHRIFVTSQIMVFKASYKLRSRGEESTPAQRLRVEKAIEIHARYLNVAMYHWRAVRRTYKDYEQLTVDKDATITDLDKRCESMEETLAKHRKEMQDVRELVQVIRTTLEQSQYPAGGGYYYGEHEEIYEQQDPELEAVLPQQQPYHPTTAGGRPHTSSDAASSYTSNPMHQTTHNLTQE